MPSRRLTFHDTTLRSLPIPECGQIMYRDAASPLYVRVSQGGSKTFIVSLKSGHRHTIGRVGELSLKDARDAARRIRAEKTLGKYVNASVHLDRARVEYLAQLTVRRNTRTYYERNLNKLEGRTIADITPHDVNQILDHLGPTSRNQALGSFRAFFSWAIRKHYLDRSPCERMALSKSSQRARVLSDDALRRVWTAAHEMGGSFGTIVKLLILTGQRRGEIAALQTSWIKDETIVFPESVTKNKREHYIPIGALCSSILPSQSFNGLLFSARGKPSQPFNG